MTLSFTISVHFN